MQHALVLLTVLAAVYYLLRRFAWKPASKKECGGSCQKCPSVENITAEK